MTDVEINLRDLVRGVANEYPKAQPSEIARHVAKLTPQQYLLEFYEETLRPFVVSVLGTDRNNALHKVFDEPDESDELPTDFLASHRNRDAQDRPAGGGQTTEDGHPVRDTQAETAVSGPTSPPPKQEFRPSPKVTGIRNYNWTRMLRKKVHTENGHKPIGDCDENDLKFCIEVRRKHIADVQHRTTSYEKLIELLHKHNVSTVGDLPAQDKAFKL
jgi:hypothetical protein